ncbi:cation:proton antiporter [Streptomyces mirabilis]|uniref:cation:proton antiporter n=1 Tax=Streptomyces mirabilis TaxID=68239 RepID=UPI00331A7D39
MNCGGAHRKPTGSSGPEGTLFGDGDGERTATTLLYRCLRHPPRRPVSDGFVRKVETLESQTLVAAAYAPSGTLLGALALILTAAYVFAWLARRVRQPIVVGKIVAGIALGPSVLGLLPGDLVDLAFPADVRPYLQVLAQLGLVLFMFDAGPVPGRGHVHHGVSGACADHQRAGPAAGPHRSHGFGVRRDPGLPGLVVRSRAPTGRQRPHPGGTGRRPPAERLDHRGDRPARGVRRIRLRRDRPARADRRHGSSGP